MDGHGRPWTVVLDVTAEGARRRIAGWASGGEGVEGRLMTSLRRRVGRESFGLAGVRGISWLVRARRGAELEAGQIPG